MTLTFGSSNPSEFVDCGEFTAKTPAEQFNGKYLDFLTRYYNASLSGKMNILVRPVGGDQTQVRVNARYIVTVPSTPQTRGEQFAFDSGGRDVKVISNAMAGTTNTRICQPTYKAENSILEAISDLAQR